MAPGASGVSSRRVLGLPGQHAQHIRGLTRPEGSGLEEAERLGVLPEVARVVQGKGTGQVLGRDHPGVGRVGETPVGRMARRPWLGARRR